jgi:LmbE family N-acetylglucosaminyl deacetylase
MIEARFPRLRTVLCLGAHADDIEIGCGGTLLRMLSEYPHAQVYWIVFSAKDGRREEALASADRFLAEAAEKQVVVKQFRDSFFPAQCESIKECFHELARDLSPDLIFTHRRDDAHQDHRTVAELTWCAFRNHLIFEYEIPKYEGDLGQPNVFVGLDETTGQRKVTDIVETFRSQQDKPWFRADTFWSLLRIRGIECNSPGGYAEGFYCRKLVV